MALWTTDERFSTVPRWLAELLTIVLADFQQPNAIDLLVGYEAATGIVWVSERGDVARAGFGGSVARTGPADVADTVKVAQWLQEQVFPETQGAWGEPRPRCPGHAHPMAPAELDGEAWWTCPADDHRVVRIGAFRG